MKKKKISLKKIVLVMCIVLVVLVAILIFKNIASKKQKVDIPKEETTNLGNSYLNNQNIYDYYDVTIDFKQIDGDYAYTITMKTKNENVIAELNSIDANLKLLAQYINNSKIRKKWITIPLENLEKKEEGLYILSGSYSEEGVQFSTVELDKDISKYLKIKQVDSSIYYK